MVELDETERGICLLALIKMQHFWNYMSPIPWVNVPEERIESLIVKMGFPSDDEVMLVCSECDYTQFVKVSDYRENLAFGGHPYTCPKHSRIALTPATRRERE